MDLLEQVKNIHGVDAALGLCFCRGKHYTPMLPDGATLIGYTDQVYFCFVDGYQDTVFAVVNRSGFGSLVYPLAYDFREFLRLIISCGSADLVVRAGTCPEESFCGVPFSGGRKKVLEVIGRRFDLQPVENPSSYIQTVRQVIDCRAIRC